jgi:hypothetical protein
MKSKFLTAFSIIFLLSILSLATASAGTMELSSGEGKIILKISDNDIPIAAGRIFMKTAEALTLYKPTGTGFLSSIYAIKGTNSDMEIQFFDPIANKQLGQLEIPFTCQAGTYTFQITKIEFYNKSDYLIPFNQPLQTRITITPPAPQPPSDGGGGTIGSKAGGETITEPEATPATVGEAGTSGAGAGGTGNAGTTVTGSQQKTNQTAEEKTNVLPPILPIAGFSIAIAVVLGIILYEILHHKRQVTIPLSFQPSQ